MHPPWGPKGRGIANRQRGGLGGDTFTPNVKNDIFL